MSTQEFYAAITKWSGLRNVIGLCNIGLRMIQFLEKHASKRCFY